MNFDEIVPFGIVLHPTESEFKDFKAYMYSIMQNQKFKDAGCVKVF